MKAMKWRKPNYLKGYSGIVVQMVVVVATVVVGDIMRNILAHKDISKRSLKHSYFVSCIGGVASSYSGIIYKLDVFVINGFRK